MSVRSIVMPLDEMQAIALKKGAQEGTPVLDWFFANEVPKELRLVASSILLQPSRLSSLLGPNPGPQVTPVFYFFFEEAPVIQ